MKRRNPFDPTGGDELSREGEYTTVVICEDRHTDCGGRIQFVRNSKGRGESIRHCRGCGRRIHQ